MPFQTLVSAEIVANRLNDPKWAMVDCRFDLNDHAVGTRLYKEKHIPGAVYAHLNKHLSAPSNGKNGRHPLPDTKQLQSTFSKWGIDSKVQVVAYDQGSGMFASRLWWLLRYLGHDNVAVLDGGFAHWLRGDHPTYAGEESRGSVRFSGEPHHWMCVSVDEVLRLYQDPSCQLIDARAPERYRGDVEPLDPVAGHIPDSVNHFFKNNLTSDGTFLPPSALRQRLESILNGHEAERAISYCGSGVTACHNLLALTHAGLSGARLYAGSWSEWCADQKRPTEKS